jgi:hypothetical protein
MDKLIMIRVRYSHRNEDTHFWHTSFGGRTIGVAAEAGGVNEVEKSDQACADGAG